MTKKQRLTKRTVRREEKKQEQNLLCTTLKTLIAADELLTEKSWIKGAFRQQKLTGLKMCAVGAVHEAAQNKLKLPDWSSHPAVQQTRRELDHAAPIRTGIVNYNDAYAKSVDDVKKVFKAAIRNVEKKIEAL